LVFPRHCRGLDDHARFAGWEAISEFILAIMGILPVHFFNPGSVRKFGWMQQ
jgi:hypothetical protein